MKPIHTPSIYEEPGYWDDGKKDNFGYGTWENWKPISEVLKKHLEVESVLDAGCDCGAFIGTGVFQKAEGVDFSVFATSHPLPGAEGKLTHSDLTYLPFPDQHFDMVTCFSTMEHIPHHDIDMVIWELSRVAKKWLVFSIATTDTTPKVHDFEYPGFGEIPKELSEAMQYQVQRGHWTLHNLEWWKERIGFYCKIRDDVRIKILSETGKFIPDCDSAWNHKDMSLIIAEAPRTNNGPKGEEKA